MRFRKLGRFTVSGLWLHSWTDADISNAARLFDGMVVLRTDYSQNMDATVYTAAGEMFDAVAFGDIAPMYDAVFDAGSDVPRWVRQ